MSNYSSSEGEEESSNISDQTYVKPSGPWRGEGATGDAASKLPKNFQPSYLTMVQDAVVKLSEGLGPRGTVSRAKISDYMMTRYGLHDAMNNRFFKKAIKVAVEKEIIESSSANCKSFKLTKAFKEKQKSAEKALTKKQSTSKLKKDKPVKETTKEKASSEEESKSSEKKRAKLSGKKTQKVVEDDKENAKDEKKKIAKKPPTGKEQKGAKKTKAVNEKATVSTSEKKILKEKINTMKKATSTGTLKQKQPVVEEEPDDLSTPEEEPEPKPEPEPTTKRKRGRKAAAK